MRNESLDSGQIIINLIVILITFCFAAFFVACEFALVQTRPSALEEALDNGEGSKARLKRSLKMVTNLNEYLSTTQVGVSVAGIILGWLGESTLSAILIDLLNITHTNPGGATAHAIGAVVGVLLLTYLEVVFTEIVPKNISIDMPMQVLCWVTTPLHYFHILFYRSFGC